MKWDIFSGRRTEETRSIRDDIKDLVKDIEKFAPRKHRADRESFFYNYQFLDAYLNPLFFLLSVISQRKSKSGDRGDWIRELFLKLKDFYDPKQRLSIAEAIQDKNLIRKLAQIFLIFYDKKDITKGEIVTFLQELTADE